MKEVLRLRQTITSGQLPVHLLAAVGMLTIPESWCMPLFAIAIGMYVVGKRVTEADFKTFWKAPEFQRLVVGGTLLWIFAAMRDQLGAWVRYLSPANFFTPASVDPTFGLAWGLLLAAIGLTITMYRRVRFCPRGAASPELDRKLQAWTNATCFAYMTFFVSAILLTWLVPGGVGDWLANWLIASSRDASLFGMSSFTVPTIEWRGAWDQPTIVVQPPQSIPFELFTKLAAASATCLLVWRQMTRSAVFLTSFSKQMSVTPITKVGDTFLRTIRAPYTSLSMREKRPFLKNVAGTFWWLLICYAALFYICGFMGGPLGDTVQNWLFATVGDAGSLHIYSAQHRVMVDAPQTDLVHLRIFLGAIVALYGTVPVAVMSCTFLPYFKRRQVHLTCDGLTFPDGPYLSLGFRQMHLWSDLALVDVIKKKRWKKSKIVIKFHSGGKIELLESQFTLEAVDKLLGAIDEHASNCVVTDAVVALRAEIRAKIALDGKSTDLGNLSAQNFQSTIFVPHDQGTWLPSGEARVVRLLASRPLSCVYLVRLNSGKLAIAKQFFFAEDTDQRDALRKTFEREYELLQKIDHARVSKVIEVFHREQSTYLLIEHAAGTDLRRMVADEGAQTEGTVIDWALQICDIMLALHGHEPPIVHRDLTPDNVILAEDGSLRIIDFGAAHQFMEGITGTIIGKQCYVPPEQLRGQAGPASDVYSFGCTLYYLLTGDEPVALTQCNPNTKLTVSNRMNELVMACTEFDQEKRPQSFTNVRTILEEIKADRSPKQVLKKLAEAVVAEEVKPETKAEEEAPPTVVSIKEREKVAEWS